MNNRTSTKLSLNLFFALLLLFKPAVSFANTTDNWSVINKAVNHSIQEVLPSGSQWETKAPSFLQEMDDEIEDIEVTFPSSLGGTHFTAQVWVKAHGETSLYAVPVKVNNLGASSIELAQR
jgi:hypothetical protein